MKKGYLIPAFAAAVAGVAAAGALFLVKNSKTDDVLYRDIAVEYGTLTAGITKNALLSLGETEQMLDLDINTLTGEESGTWELQVDEVLVSEGQQVRKGTPLIRFTSDSVKALRSVLQKEIMDTNKDYELLKAKQKELRLQVSQGYDNYVTDGKYAGVVYSNKCEVLQEQAGDAKKAVEQKQNQVNENLLELTQTQQELAEAQKYLREAEIAVSENYSDRYDRAYYYTVYENTRETAEKMVRQLEEKTESLTAKNESLLYEVDEAVRAYHQILLDSEKEKLAAKLDCDTEIYHSKMASEWYDIQIISLDNALQEARERYESALHKIRVFDACVVRNEVISAHNGVISDIAAEAGERVSRGSRLVTLCDMETVTMDVWLSGEEFLAVNQGEPVKITFADCPEEIYAGRIAEASLTNGDSQSKNPCYIVTVALQGDAAGLYDGMAGDVTLMTGETKEALSVPRKAVFREGKRFYVKQRRENGDIAEKDVTTGCSDGIRVEIIKGLSEGDAVLIPLSE